MLIVTGTRSPGPRSVNTFSFFFFERNRDRRMKRVSSTVCRSPSKSDRHSSAPRPAKITANSSPPDRKSTRLNSSHLVISYAVFCLKKKKTARLLTHGRMLGHGLLGRFRRLIKRHMFSVRSEVAEL